MRSLRGSSGSSRDKATSGDGLRHTTPVARILLIDDDPSLLDALTLAFEDAGHEVLVARDGGSGADLVGREKPALVISDINMP